MPGIKRSQPGKFSCSHSYLYYVIWLMLIFLYPIHRFVVECHIACVVSFCPNYQTNLNKWKWLKFFGSLLCYVCNRYPVFTSLEILMINSLKYSIYIYCVQYALNIGAWKKLFLHLWCNHYNRIWNFFHVVLLSIDFICNCICS